MVKRVSRREKEGQGAGSLIAGLLYRDEFFHDVLADRRSQGGIQRVSGSPDFTEYGGPSGLHSPYMNLLTVAKDGADFNWVSDALDYIQDASAENPYTILTYPGRYDEYTEMKEYVSLVGFDRDVCIIGQPSWPSVVTVLMASHSSLHEIQVVDEASGAYAVRVVNEEDVLIDSCIIRAVPPSGSAVGLQFLNSSDVRILGSEIEVNNAYAWAFPMYIFAQTDDCIVDIRYTKIRLVDAQTIPSAGVYVLAQSGYTAEARIFHCPIMVRNQNAAEHGINVESSGGGVATVFVEHDTIEHEYDVGGGYDIRVEGANSEVHVRASRYSTWNPVTGGQILPLAGDRPRLECVEVAADFTITAGAGVWQDTNCAVTIDLPCESDLKVELAGAWAANTTRDMCAAFQVDLDGTSQAGDTSWLGMPNPDCRQPISVVAGFFNVPAGSHTITVQAVRNNAGDSVAALQQNLCVESVPWP